MFDMFDTLVRPILTYGSDVWGMSKAGLDVLDKVFLHYARRTLGIKATTCNVITYGEWGKYPPSVFLSNRSIMLPALAADYVRRETG